MLIVTWTSWTTVDSCRELAGDWPEFALLGFFYSTGTTDPGKLRGLRDSELPRICRHLSAEASGLVSTAQLLRAESAREALGSR